MCLSDVYHNRNYIHIFIFFYTYYDLLVVPSIVLIIEYFIINIAELIDVVLLIC